MPLEIDGSTYVSAAELVEQLGVARQTLWRWRQDGKIPAGHRFRGRQWFFTAAEAELVREYAFRIEPIDPGPINQLKLFSGRTGGGT
jgi:hypothetical protein